MAISCLEINQTINELLIAFQDCNKIKNEDLRLLVELVAAVNSCANGGAHYDTLISENYEPSTDTIISYPVNTFHSINIMVLSGTITRIIDGDIVTFSAGTILRHEVTTLNQYIYEFTAKAGSHVVVEYLIETI